MQEHVFHAEEEKQKEVNPVSNLLDKTIITEWLTKRKQQKILKLYLGSHDDLTEGSAGNSKRKVKTATLMCVQSSTCFSCELPRSSFDIVAAILIFLNTFCDYLG